VISISTQLLHGSGTLPEVSLGSIVGLSTEIASGSLVFWNLASKPDGSLAYLHSPSQASTRLQNLDICGVYLVELWVDFGTPQQQFRTTTVVVPPSVSPLPPPPEPLYDTGGRVRNFSFELAGVVPGEALYWDTLDVADLLAHYAGISRGRITPVNFTVTSGVYVMCLGDDVGNNSDVLASGEVFSVSQVVDLTNVDTLTLQMKYTQR